jgi:hypothetical protein
MPNILLSIDEPMARALKRVAPPRQRSRFVRLAIQKALMELQELETRKAYERWPDTLPDKWSTPARRRTRRR